MLRRVTPSSFTIYLWQDRLSGVEGNAAATSLRHDCIKTYIETPHHT